MELVASIEKIIEIKKHPNADKLDICTVLGFQTITKRDEYKPGDFIIYVKSDSILKEHPCFEFLRDKKFRIRPNTKLRGEISNGICFPLSILWEQFKFSVNLSEIYEGYDVSEIIGASHYEKPIPSTIAGKIRGNFPSDLIHKTDETRLQAEPEVLKELIGIETYVTLKCDGTSFTIVNKDGNVEICSRNLSMKIEDEDSRYVKIAKQYDLINKLIAKGNYGIQGELVGEAIQGNPMGIKGHKLFVFNVWDVEKQKNLDYDDMISFCKELELETVPLIMRGIFGPEIDMQYFIEMSRGKYEGTNNHREGIVIRPTKETYSNVLMGRLSVKIINPDYKDEE